MKKKGTCGSHFKIKKKKRKTKEEEETGERERETEREGKNYLFFFSHFFIRFTKIGPSEFVGARSKVMYSTRATHENQKHGISPSF